MLPASMCLLRLLPRHDRRSRAAGDINRPHPDAATAVCAADRANRTGWVRRGGAGREGVVGGARRRPASAWWLLIAGVAGLAAALTLTVEKIRQVANPDYIPSCSINPVLSCGS